MDQPSLRDLGERANRMRCSIIRMTTAAKSGHPGGSLSAADIVATLYFGGVMHYDQEDPTSPGRDRFILSKGHAAPVLYAALAELGIVEDDELDTLRHLGSRLQGHPDMLKLPGVEVSTGSLGQGLSISAGLALALLRKVGEKGGRVPTVFTLLGDGELQEGQNWEALMFASHMKLKNLVAIVDHNDLQIDGKVEDVMSLGDLRAKFTAFGWVTETIDGHNLSQVREALIRARDYEGGPYMIIANTIKGKGVSFMENVCEWHGKAPSIEQSTSALDELHGAIASEVGE